MKKKVFTLLTLLVAIVTGASAAVTDLSFTATKTIAAGGEIWWTTSSNVATANTGGWCSNNGNNSNNKYGNITPNLTGDVVDTDPAYHKIDGVLVKGGNTPSNLTTSKKGLVFKVTNTTAITAYGATTASKDDGSAGLQWSIYKASDNSAVATSAKGKAAAPNTTATISISGLSATETYIVSIEGGYKGEPGADVGSSNQDVVLYAVKFVAPEATTPTIAASDVNITEDATDAGEIAFSLDKKETSGTVTAAEKVEADWLTLGAVGEGTVPFTATANTGAVARTATVTLTYTYNTSETVTKDVTITQEANVVGTAIIRADLTSATGADVTGSLGGSADVKLKLDSEKYKFAGKGNYVGLTLSSGSFRTGDIINVHTSIAAAQGTIMIYDDKDGTNIYQETGTMGVLGDNKFVLNSTVNGTSTIYVCRTEGNNWNGYVDYISVTRPNAVVTLNASGYATYSKATDFTFLGAKAFKMALNESAKTIAGTEVSGKIAAGEGILLKGEASAPVAIMETTGAAALVDNDLKGSTMSDGNLADKPTYCYVLSGDTFKKFTGGTLTANKAYFEATGDLGGHALTMTFDDGETTAIKAIEAKKVENGVFYNLAGQQVAQPTKGLYIVNGKKVVLK